MTGFKHKPCCTLSVKKFMKDGTTSTIETMLLNQLSIAIDSSEKYRGLAE